MRVGACRAQQRRSFAACVGTGSLERSRAQTTRAHYPGDTRHGDPITAHPSRGLSPGEFEVLVPARAGTVRTGVPARRERRRRPRLVVGHRPPPPPPGCDSAGTVATGSPRSHGHSARLANRAPGLRSALQTEGESHCDQIPSGVVLNPAAGELPVQARRPRHRRSSAADGRPVFEQRSAPRQSAALSRSHSPVASWQAAP